MEGIQVSVEKAGPGQSVAVIRVGGYIDTTTSAELEHQLSSVLKSNCSNVVIDLGKVDYISSAGWGIFISEIKGIRERGGDLKLVHMIPDVYEVFELLEFHYILKAFDTVEEAISDFDSTVPSNSTLKSPSRNDGSQAEPTTTASTSEAPSKVAEMEAPHRDPVSKTQPQSQSLEDKLRQIVMESPDSGVFNIAKTLNTSRFGNVKLGFFEMRKHLKKMNLETKKKRIAYFKQKTFG